MDSNGKDARIARLRQTPDNADWTFQVAAAKWGCSPSLVAKLAAEGRIRTETRVFGLRTVRFVLDRVKPPTLKPGSLSAAARQVAVKWRGVDRRREKESV